MLNALANVDRRWIFLLMGLAVGVPILMELRPSPTPEASAQAVFDRIEAVPAGGTVLMAWDYDPASAGELKPMATMMTRHAAARGLKMVYLCIFSPASAPMIEESINLVLKPDFPNLKYGEDYVNLGYKAGNEGVVKVVATDFRDQFKADVYGTPLDDLPATAGLRSLRDTDLIVNPSAGYPGTKEWILYGVSPYPKDVSIVAGATGVQAPLLLPYVPDQMPGLLAAIKGAADYETLVMEAYPDAATPKQTAAKYVEARRRMGPQEWGHLLMIALIVAGNVIFLTGGAARSDRLAEPSKTKTDGVVALGLLALLVAFAAWKGAGVIDVVDTGDGVVRATAADRIAGDARTSWVRTAGVWTAGLGTVFVFSFLWRDNPCYKLAESVLVGVSAAFWMLVGFWDVIVPDVLGVLMPGWTKTWATPAAGGELTPWGGWDDWMTGWAWTLVPLVLGVLLLMRLSPKGGWLSRWPLAFVIGVFSGLRLTGFIEADFLGQIRAGVMPLVVFDEAGALNLERSVLNTTAVLGTLAALTYFFFSAKQKGTVGLISRFGILMLMVTFGAAFGTTVMGRIALLAARLEFLFDDWLWLIDPGGRRFGM